MQKSTVAAVVAAALSTVCFFVTGLAASKVSFGSDWIVLGICAFVLSALPAIASCEIDSRLGQKWLPELCSYAIVSGTVYVLGGGVINFLATDGPLFGVSGFITLGAFGFFVGLAGEFAAEIADRRKQEDLRSLD